MSEPKRPNTIQGYEHPEELKYSREGIYKTFTEGKKKRKDEKFGTTTVGKQYATYGKEEEDKEDECNVCPTCNEKSVSTCPCVYSDKKCNRGHVWYIDRDGIIKFENPH